MRFVIWISGNLAITDETVNGYGSEPIWLGIVDCIWFSANYVHGLGREFTIVPDLFEKTSSKHGQIRSRFRP
jgi:hypothetical protein